MWDGIEPAAFDGLRYLRALGAQPVRPSAGMFQAFLNQPRPEKKSLTEALKASKGPSGSDLYDWMLAIGWVEVEENEQVSITDLGLAVLGAAADTKEIETVVVESAAETAEVETAEVETEVVESTPDLEELVGEDLPEVALSVEEAFGVEEAVDELSEAEPFIIG